MAHSYSASSTDEHNAVLYKALMQKETSTNLVKLCEHYPEGPLHVLTINGDTVLHMAAHTAKANIVIQLLEMLPPNECCKLIHQNAVGNTILHEAATFEKLVPLAKKIMEMAPELSSMCNELGETALFTAARYGQIEMFKFLDTKVGDQTIKSEAERKPFYQNHNNNTTVLHMAVIMGHFDLALLIAEQCKYLVFEKDEHGMTALQHLAQHSVTFEARNAGFLKHLVYYCLLEAEKLKCLPAVRGKDAQPVRRVPLWEAIWKEMVKYESAKKLASFLVELDTTSWKETDCEKSKTEAPLFLAIKAGCVDIVEMILKRYPQAVEHVDSNGCTILHIAVKYRQERVFNLLDQVGIPWRRFIVQRDRDLNTILHMVGKKDSIHGTGNKNPILKLQNDLILFENIKEICSSCSVDTSLYRNREGKTASEVFVENEEKLRTEAVEWVKFITESSSWPSVFIAAAAFSALYTIPGGLDEDTGVPNFVKDPFFLIFVIAAVLCLLFTTISLALFFSVLASSFSFKDFKLFIPARIVLGIASLLLSVSMLALALGATIFLIVKEKEEENLPLATRIGLYTIGFLPLTVVSLSFLPNYIFLTRVFMSNIYVAGVTVPACPLYSRFSFPCFTAHLFRSRKSIPPQHSSPIKRVGETTSVV